jgi:hypothetical protein
VQCFSPPDLVEIRWGLFTVSALETRLESTRLVEPIANVIVEILLRVVRSARTGVTRSNTVNQACDDDEFLIQAFHQLRMDLIVTDEIVGSHRVK